MKKMEIIFTKSPTGTFKLAYSKGDKAEFEEQKAMELIEAGYAMPAKEVNDKEEEAKSNSKNTKSTATSKADKETR